MLLDGLLSVVKQSIQFLIINKKGEEETKIIYILLFYIGWVRTEWDWERER